MKILLVSICCLALASFAGASGFQEDENVKGKKKQAEQPAQTTQQVVKPGKNVGGGPHNANVNANVNSRRQIDQTRIDSTQPGAKKWKGPSLNAKTGGNVNTNVSGNAASTKLNKGKFSSQTNVSGQSQSVFPPRTIKAKHFNLPNQPNPKYKAVKFNGNYQIAGAKNWKGSKYVVFQNYHPQWHDQYWWTSHHNHIVFVFGSPYYWDAGYWYPCWGYNPGATFYFDGPIYASNPEYDPGQVVANVQSALQEQGYYQGEIDGILGPQTRAALAEYQSAQGLEATGAVDEPTLETLGMV